MNKSPKPTSGYLLSQFNDGPTNTNISHTPASGIWPFVGSAVICINGVDCVFIGGSRKEKDSLIKYDKESNKFINIIENTGIQKTNNMFATFCAVAFDFKNKGTEDLVIGRENNVTLYEQTHDQKFSPTVIFTHYDKVPLGLSISDYNKDMKADIYISYFTKSANYRGTVFNDKSHNRSNVLLRNDSTNNKIKFTNVTNDTNSGGLHNTFTSAFVDLDNRGFPDIVLSHDSGEVEILKNINGIKFKSIIPYDHKGNWMGLGVGDITGNGKQDLFLTNIGTDMQKGNVSLGDIKPNQKQNKKV